MPAWAVEQVKPTGDRRALDGRPISQLADWAKPSRSLLPADYRATPPLWHLSAGRLLFEWGSSASNSLGHPKQRVTDFKELHQAQPVPPFASRESATHPG